MSRDTIVHSFKTCAISLPTDGSEDGLVHDRLAMALNDREEADARAAEMLFASDSDSDAEFSGFSASDNKTVNDTANNCKTKHSKENKELKK